MKSYNHLWEQFISEENIRVAIVKSSRGKRHRRLAKLIYENQDEWIPKLRKYAENFKRVRHSYIEINDGISRKKRKIIVPNYREQVVHHMVINVMNKIFMKGMYEHSYGSIPGRGGYMGMKRVKRWIANDTRNVKYCLKMDVKKFYESVPKELLKAKLLSVIKDKRFLHVLYEIIESSEKGLPIGFYTSQWFANWYMQGLDHYIKEELHAVHYIRYIDDMVIFGSNKRVLHRIKDSIENYLNNKLGLRLKENWQVFRFDYIRKGKHYGRFLDFLGYRFYRKSVTLRRSLMLRSTRKAKKISKKIRPTIYDIRQMLSYLGWIQHTDTYYMYLKFIKPYVCFRTYKKIMSKHDRRKRKRLLFTKSNLNCFSL